MVKELQTSYKVYFNTLKTIDFIEVLDNVTMEWEGNLSVLNRLIDWSFENHFFLISYFQV